MTKLVSLRINEDVLHQLDKLMAFFPYSKKHAIMVGLLENVLMNVEPQTLRDIVYYNRFSSTKLKITTEKINLVEQPISI